MAPNHNKEAPTFSLFSRPCPKVDFLMHLGRPLALLWLPFRSPWLPFGSLLALLGSLWATFWLQLAHFGRPLAPFCSPRGSIFSLFGSPGVVFGPFLEITWKMFEKKYNLDYFSCNKLILKHPIPKNTCRLIERISTEAATLCFFSIAPSPTLARSGNLP